MSMGSWEPLGVDPSWIADLSSISISVFAFHHATGQRSQMKAEEFYEFSNRMPTFSFQPENVVSEKGHYLCPHDSFALLDGFI